MRYRHTFIVRAELKAVNDFHMRSSSMAAITPPPIIVRLHRAPQILQDGDEMHFTLWLGPLPIHWSAQIIRNSPTSFVDRQLKGPFETWEHTHTFCEIDAQHTQIIDQVEARLKPQPLWWLVGIAMWTGMPFLFAYRGWKTCKMLERPTARGSTGHK